MASHELKREWLWLAIILVVLSRLGDAWSIVVPIILLSVFYGRVFPLLLSCLDFKKIQQSIFYAVLLPLMSLTTLPKSLRIICAVSWLLYTLFLAILVFLKMVKERRQLNNLSWFYVALLMLPGGAMWLLAFVLNYALLGFPALVVLLTTIHFHFAACSNLFIIGLLAKVLPQQNQFHKVMHTITGVLVLLGFWLTAIGISESKLITSIGAGVMTLAMLFVVYLLIKSSGYLKYQFGKLVFKVLGFAMVIAMSLAITFAFLDYLNWTNLSYLSMELSHGLLNGIIYVYLVTLILVKHFATTQFVTVIYDGHCGMCSSGATLLKKIDWLNNFTYIPYQDLALYIRYPKLNPAACEQALHVIMPDGEIIAGANAIRAVLWRTPLTFLVAWVLMLPPLPWVFRKLYPVIAKNRYLISDRCRIKTPLDPLAKTN